MWQHGGEYGGGCVCAYGAAGTRTFTTSVFSLSMSMGHQDQDHAPESPRDPDPGTRTRGCTPSISITAIPRESSSVPLPLCLGGLCISRMRSDERINDPVDCRSPYFTPNPVCTTRHPPSTIHDQLRAHLMSPKPQLQMRHLHTRCTSCWTPEPPGSGTYTHTHNTHTHTTYTRSSVCGQHSDTPSYVINVHTHPGSPRRTSCLTSSHCAQSSSTLPGAGPRGTYPRA